MKTGLPNLVCAFIFLTYFASAAQSSNLLPSYELSVTLEPQNHLLKGVAKITLKNAPTNIELGTLRVKSVFFNGKPVHQKIKKGHLTILSKGILEIDYEWSSHHTANKKHDQFSIDVISNDGVSLTNRWYPDIQGLAFYNLKASVPDDFSVVSEAETIQQRDTEIGTEYTFNFPYPLTGVNLAAGRYRIIKEIMGNIKILCYFVKSDRILAERYIEFAKQYLTMYSDLIGPYPFSRFSIVENILPTGYSMPTFTLLGRKVMHLPFIMEPSLGHEVLHQWFGNSVYADHNKGNWTEGLTSYLSNHFIEKNKTKDREYRKNAIIHYQSYVKDLKKNSLKKFSSRSDQTSKAIGYGKATLFFHMLRKKVGDKTFYSSLRAFFEKYKFQTALWNDIQLLFEKKSNNNLDAFFQQWLNRTDIPKITVEDTRVVYKKGKPYVTFTLKQQSSSKQNPYLLDISIDVITDKETIQKHLHFSKKKEHFEINVHGTPQKLIIDPEYDLMRSLSPAETPPVLTRLLGDDSTILVFSPDEVDNYSGLIELFKRRGFLIKSQNDITDNDIRGSSLLLLGKENSIYKRLFGATSYSHWNNTKDDNKPGFLLTVKHHPLNSSKVIASAFGNGKKEVEMVRGKLFHYGSYSTIGFQNGKNIRKEIVPTENGIHINIAHKVRGIMPSKSMELDDIINSIADKPLIYIGESHTHYEDHMVQFEIIKALHEKGHKVAIGMEMFQKRFQRGLDDYLSGTINEKSFLRATQYFKRWKFNYNLYRDIVEYAKANKIPVIALNLESEITKKVARGGIDSLSQEERERIPADIDMSDKEYFDRLKVIHGQHSKVKGMGFHNFHISQILWDETMADSIVKFLLKSPDSQMIVLAGSGHVMYGSGIPKRVKRRSGKEYVILINANLDSFDESIADYLLFPAPLTPPSSPKLGVLIKVTNNGVKIDNFSVKSNAISVGLKKNDVILSLDDFSIKSFEDLKIALFDKKPGQPITIKILRKKLLSGRKEMLFTTTLQ